MRCALIVSANRYAHYGTLRYCHTDGHLLAQTLGAWCDYGGSSTTIRHIKLDREGGYELPAQLLAAIRETDAVDRGRSGERGGPTDDSFLFYFAGHGLFDAQTRRSYLLLPGSRPDALADTALSVRALREALIELGRPIVQVVDACHSGEAYRNRGAEREPLRPELRGFVSELKRDVDVGGEAGRGGQFGWEMLAACDEGEFSHEEASLQHGIFTYELARAIRDAPVGADLQLAWLKDVVCREVQQRSARGGLVQNPVFAARTYGPHSFARRNQHTTPRTHAPSDPIATPRAPGSVCHSVDLPARQAAEVDLHALLRASRPSLARGHRLDLLVRFNAGCVSFEVDAAPHLIKGGRSVARPVFPVAPDQNISAGPYDWHSNRLRFQFSEHQAVVTSFNLDGSEVGICVNIP